MVLTTHRMEEADDLCDRIGILINGQFATIGTPNELITKYSKGAVVCIEGDASKVEKRLRKDFSRVERMMEEDEASDMRNSRDTVKYRVKTGGYAGTGHLF